MAAREVDAASNRKAEEEDSSPEAADQKAHGTVADVDETVAGAEAAAADVDACSGDEADPFIQKLNVLSKLDVMEPEWIEEMKKNHYEEIELYHRAYDALENDDLSSDDEAGAAEFEEWSKQLWASIDFSGVNKVGGESRGVDAVAVYPSFLCDRKSQEKEEGHDASAAAESSI